METHQLQMISNIAICFDLLVSLHIFTVHIKVLFIAPIPGKKKPELAYSSVIQEEDKDIPNLEFLEKNGASPNNTLLIEKMQFRNIVKRPTKSASKVCLPLEINAHVSLCFVGCLFNYSFTFDVGIRLHAGA